MLRYRFFLIAGVFPYLLGQVMAFNRIYNPSNSSNPMNPSNPITPITHFNWQYFWLGFLGVVFALIGVELFNEYFDSKEGGDRIFSLSHIEIPHYFFYLGILVFLLAFFIGAYLSFRVGWPILLFSFLGFLSAYFYVGPPLRWAYRGLGEVVISLSYGPFMVLGSYYLQIQKVDFVPFLISLIFGLTLFCLAIINEIPDYYQDRLVGKKNLVVRLGKKKALRLLFIIYLFLFLSLIGGVFTKIIPISGIFVFIVLPWLFKTLKKVKKNLDTPQVFLKAINVNLYLYLLIVFSLSMGYLFK
jgi:1,4-dihydroxy-2-naphthoate octaprenyltransferase